MKNTDSSGLPEQETSKSKEPSALFMLVGVICLIIGAVAALAECFGITLFCILFFVCALVCEIK